MNKYLLFWGLLFIGITTCATAQTIQEKLDSLLTKRSKAGTFNGSVLIAAKDTILLEKGYGKKNLASGTFNDANTIYQIGSVTKQFTAAVILWLQEQKKLSLSEKLSKYFPDFPDGNKVTIEHLLTHTSGIHNYTDSLVFVKGAMTKPISKESMMALIKSWPLDFEPGTQWNYSNSGYILLGYIIEKVTKKPYETIVRNLIFRPLGMQHSGFDFANLQSSDKATGYNILNDKPTSIAGIVDSTVSYAAGAIYTTVGDLYKWERAIHNNKIISAASWQKAFTPKMQQYGYGWMIDTLLGHKQIHHGGGIIGFNSNLAFFPTEDFTILLFSNVSTPLLDLISKEITATLLGKDNEPSKKRTAITLPEAVLKQYVGVYELTPQFKFTITLENGMLRTQATGQIKIDIFPESESEFFLKVVDAQISFIKDNSGKVEKMILHQNGRDMPARKIE